MTKEFALETSKLIMKAYDADEFLPIIVYGPLGWGKSAYAIKVAALVYGGLKDYNYEAVKDYLVFHPRDFLKKCHKMPIAERRPVLIWDDAGLWLHALEHNDPFVKATAKYLNVARTDWAAIIFTTPWPTWIVKKVRGLPQCMMTKIMKAGGSDVPNLADPEHLTYHYKRRIARTYLSWIAPDMKKSGVRTIHQDRFTAWLPNDFFDWYRPQRDQYAEVAKRMMADALAKLDLDKVPEGEKEAIEEVLDASFPMPKPQRLY